MRRYPNHSFPEKFITEGQYLTLDESVAVAPEDRGLMDSPAPESPAVHLVMLLVLGVVHGVSAFSG